MRPFAEIEPDEVFGVIILTTTVFLLLTAYYLLKTAREPLILLGGGAEVKSYASAGQSVLLLVVARAYSEVAKRTSRMKLIAIVYSFFAANLVLFAILAKAEVSALGVIFYLWVGVFNVTAIAQFWSFAADIYTQEQGKRVFAIVGTGSSVGALAGAAIAKKIVAFGLGPAGLMLGAALILLVCIGSFAWVNHRLEAALLTASKKQRAEEPPGNETAFSLLIRDKYLMYIAASLLLLNWVNSNGEYVLDHTLLATVKDMPKAEAGKFISEFKADYFLFFNLGGLLLQFLAVSRILRVFGVKRALLLLPAASAVAYAMLLFTPVLAIVRWAKVVENSIDYSVQSTTQQALYLVTSRAEKYVGKALVDTLFVRLGDVMSALTVWLGSSIALEARGFAGVNLILIGVWVFVLLAIGKENSRRAELTPQQLAREPLAA